MNEKIKESINPTTPDGALTWVSVIITGVIVVNAVAWTMGFFKTEEESSFESAEQRSFDPMAVTISIPVEFVSDGLAIIEIDPGLSVRYVESTWKQDAWCPQMKIPDDIHPLEMRTVDAEDCKVSFYQESRKHKLDKNSPIYKGRTDYGILLKLNPDTGYSFYAERNENGN